MGLPKAPSPDDWTVELRSDQGTPIHNSHIMFMQYIYITVMEDDLANGKHCALGRFTNPHLLLLYYIDTVVQSLLQYLLVYVAPCLSGQ